MLRIFSEIHDRSSLYNSKNLQHEFLDWKLPPPSLRNFSENSSVLVCELKLINQNMAGGQGDGQEEKDTGAGKAHSHEKGEHEEVVFDNQ